MRAWIVEQTARRGFTASRCAQFALSGSIQQDLVGQIRSKSVLIVGRMMRDEAYKGHDRLIQGWPLVLKTVPGAQLVIVGEGDDVGRLKTLARQLNVAGNILFTGRVSDETLDAIYAKSSVFAMPSRMLKASRRR